MNPSWFAVLFFVSGFCALVCETVWLRLAMASFGVTAPFVSIFVCAFMAGLGLGSWAAGALCQRWKRRSAAFLLRSYAAVWALAVPALLVLGQRCLATAAWQSLGYYAASGLCTTLALLPGCMAMGATFPLAMAAIEKRFAALRESSFSYLYLANVLGAAAGTLTCAFLLIETFGFHGTLRVCALLNLSIAAIAAALSRRISRAGAPDVEAPGPANAAASRSNAAPAHPLLLLFVTGFASMGMEIVWIRQFTPCSGTTIYAFAAVLAVYLTASALGSWL
jgi:predicted membrane-bound spermidine synthase